ncbi:hypothetical protein [Flavobacterium fluviatile]|uniref:hypothetical protein n=1 Tax=Flavobacterium fluviatile TaxID=1862387 RepID=UPI0013D61309|nr:hypothetical protein [Flavobacterium fluviatile]
MSNTVYILNEKLLSSERKRFIGIIVDFFFVYVTVFLSGLIMVIIGNVFNLDIFSVWEEFVIGYTFLAFFTFLIINYFIMEFFWEELQANS